MNAIRNALIGGLLAALLVVAPAVAAPAAQSVELDVAPTSLMIYPLGTARLQLAIANPTEFEQVYVLDVLLLREDGSIATTYLSDPIAIAPNYATTAIYSIRHAEGAVVAAVTPRAWPELTP